MTLSANDTVAPGVDSRRFAPTRTPWNKRNVLMTYCFSEWEPRRRKTSLRGVSGMSFTYATSPYKVRRNAPWPVWIKLLEEQSRLLWMLYQPQGYQLLPL